MIDLIYTKNGTPSGLAAQNDEAEDITDYITAKLIDDGVALENAERLAEQVVAWCQTANSGDEYTALDEYGFEIYAYDEIRSAEKAESLANNVQNEVAEPAKAESAQRLSIRDKLQMLKKHQNGHTSEGQDRANINL